MLLNKKPLAKFTRIDEDELQQLKKRTDIATIIIIIFIAVLVSRLWFLQIHKGPEYQDLADNNRVRVLDIIAPRGNIVDRHGKIIVTNRPAYNIVWTKEDAPDPDAVIRLLTKLTNDDIADFLERIRDAADNPAYIPIALKQDIDWQTLVNIENNRYRLPGIRIEAVPRRDYLYGNLTSHLIGHLGEINQQELDSGRWQNYRGGDQVGKTGLEQLFEPHMRGEKGKQYMEVNALGFEQRQLKGLNALPGNDVHLTIDVDLQKAAEDAMAGIAGAVVAMEVDSGRLLALASAPALNLDEFIGGISTKSWQALLNDPRHPLVDKTIMGQYPPGSTYKVVPALGGLAEGIITPQTTFFCSGSIRMGDREFRCWKKGGHGTVNLHRALTESCDVFFYLVGQRLGVDLLAQYARGFGLGNKTGIILQNEKAGLIPTSEWKKKAKGIAWQKGETLSISIGQGFDLCTPLQLAGMIAVVANGGKLYQPLLVDRITDPAGQVLESFSPVLTGEMAENRQALQLIRDGLVAVVNDPRGTGKEARLANITVAGKTGTAQVIKLAKDRSANANDIPYQYRDHAWFVCYAPAEKPEIAVAVLVEHGGHGGSVAAPIARQVLQKYFNGTENQLSQAGKRKENNDTL